MGSREAIADEKGSLAEGLPPSGSVVLNADDDSHQRSPTDKGRRAALWTGDPRYIPRRPIIAGGFRDEVPDHAFGRRVEAHLPVLGVHMVRNSLLAVGTGHVFGMSLEECAAGLGSVQLTKGRLEQKVVRGIQVLDDSYNANPDSTKAALLTLSQISINGRRIAVLGRMGELGQESERGHRSVGQCAADLGIDCVITVGADAALIAEEAWRGGVAKIVRAR
jgi:UDP-N-acetylmuramoyl-tripeptide--D-alanyl-D-alanine ligase